MVEARYRCPTYDADAVLMFRPRFCMGISRNPSRRKTDPERLRRRETTVSLVVLGRGCRQSVVQGFREASGRYLDIGML